MRIGNHQSSTFDNDLIYRNTTLLIVVFLFYGYNIYIISVVTNTESILTTRGFRFCIYMIKEERHLKFLEEHKDWCLNRMSKRKLRPYLYKWMYLRTTKAFKIDWNDLKVKYDFMCLRCKKKEPDIILEPDHIIPLSKGGESTMENIQPLCGRCNKIKRIDIIDYR